MSGNNSDQEEKEMTGDDEKKPKENITDDNETGNDVSDTTDKKDDDKDESDEDSDESEVGLFDRPVEVSGVRERKQVQRLEMSFNKPAKETEISEGSGEKLGQCPRIESQISKNASSELKSLHRILYNRPGAIHEVKKNIRKFRGFPFSEGSAEYDKKKSALAKINLSELKHISTILDLEKTGTKEDIVNRVLLFLLKPKPSGKKVHEEKKKKSSKAGKKTRGKKKQVTAKKATGDSSDIIDSTSGSEAEAAMSEDDCEENEKSKKKDTGKEKGKQKMIPQKKMKKTVESSDGCSDDDDEEDEEEEEEEEKKDSESSDSPTEDAIKDVIAKILKNSNLHEITMNKVFQQVCDAFPGHDLKHKKEFIKTVVKSGI